MLWLPQQCPCRRLQAEQRHAISKCEQACPETGSFETSICRCPWKRSFQSSSLQLLIMSVCPGDVAKRGLACAWPCGKKVKVLSLIQNLALTNEDQGENRYRLKQKLGLAARWPQGNKSWTAPMTLRSTQWSLHTDLAQPHDLERSMRLLQWGLGRKQMSQPCVEHITKQLSLGLPATHWFRILLLSAALVCFRL